MPKENDFLKEVGKRIANKRNELDLTQEELAEIADVTPQMISTAERGAKALRPENLLKISKALNVSADFLLTGNDDTRIISISDISDELTPEQMKLVGEVIEICIQLSRKKQ